MSELRLGLTAEDRASPVVAKFLQQLNAIQPTADQVNNELRKLGFTVDSTGKVFNQAGQAIGDKTATALRNLATGGDVANRTLQRLGDQTVRGVQNFQQQTEAIDKTTGATGRFSTSIGDAIKAGAGFAAGFAGINSVAGALSAAATAAAGFQTAQANVNTLIAKNVPLQQELREQLLALPPVLGSSTELAKGLYEVLSAGVEPAKAVAFLEQSANLAKAGLASLDTTTAALTKTMAAYNIPVERASEVSDILFKIVDVGQGNLQQFAGAMPQITQLSASMGISLKDTAAAMATLSQTFKSADTAATGYRSLLQQLIQNSDQFLALGINIRKVIDEQGLLGVVKTLQQVTQGSQERLRTFVNDIEGFNAALALTGPQFNTLIANQKKFQEATGSVAAAVKIQTETAASAWQTFVNSLDRLLQEAAPPTLSFFSKLLDAGTFSVKEISATFKGELSPALARSIEQYTAAEDALEIYSSTQLKAAATIKEQAQQTVLAKNAQEAYTLVFKDANAAALGLSQGLQRLKSDTLEAIPATEMTQRVQAVIKNLQDMQTSGVFSAHDIRSAFEEAAKVLRDKFGELPPAFQTVFDKMREGARGSADDIQRAFSGAGIQTRERLQELASEALKNFRTILDSGKATPQELLDVWQKDLKLINDAGFQTLPPDFQAMNNRIQEIARKAGVELPKPYRDAFGQMRTDGQQAVNDLATTIRDTIPAAFQYVEESVNRFGVATGRTFNALGEEVNQFGNAITQLSDETFNLMTAKIEPILQKFPDTLQGVQDKINQINRDLANVPFLSTTGTKGTTYQDAVRKQYEDQLKILEDKLKSLQQQDKTTKDQLATPVKAPSGGLASTGLGGQVPAAPPRGTGALGVGGMALPPPSPPPAFITGMPIGVVTQPIPGAPITGTLQPGQQITIGVPVRPPPSITTRPPLITGMPLGPVITHPGGPGAAPTIQTGGQPIIGMPPGPILRDSSRPLTGAGGSTGTGGGSPTVVHQTVNLTVQSTFAPSTPHLQAAVKQILPLLRDASGRGQLTPAQPGR